MQEILSGKIFIFSETDVRPVLLNLTRVISRFLFRRRLFISNFFCSLSIKTDSKSANVNTALGGIPFVAFLKSSPSTE